MTRPQLAAAMILATTLLSPPLTAQETGPEGEKINQVIVYGDDKCEQSSSNEIVVCSRLPEEERFRVPKIFRGGSPTDPRNQAWANKVVALERVGRFGTDSCSPTGLGGFTGCTQALVAGAEAERKAADKTDWEAMISEERAKRMAGIDAAAANVEAAVEADQKAMAERQRKAAELEERGGARMADASDDSDGEGNPDAEPLPMPPPK